jgi:PAS domain S-box-containing protein
MTRKPPTHSAPFAVVVDDDPTQLGVLSGLVRKAGLEPRAFAGAEAALADMSARAAAADGDPGALPALIVTDLYMPGIDGWRFCRLLRSPEYAALNQVPILVVSATYAGEEADRIAADLGAEAFLPSPVDGRRFVEQVRAILTGRQMRSPLRVLIVEDGKALAGKLKKAFEANGYEAHTALTARAAAAAFKKAAYDVAVLDYHLPDGTGDALLDTFRAARPDCVCLMMTTDPGPELALDWMKRGAAACLRKPFKPEYLLELCGRARREHALLRVQDLLEVRTRALRLSEERYQWINDASQDSLCSFDLDDRFTSANQHLCATLGLSAALIIGRTPAELGFPADRCRDLAAMHRKTLDANGPLVFEGDTPMPDGRIRVFEFTMSPMRDGDGRLVGISETSRDVTERKRAQAALQELKVRVGSQEIFHVLVETASDGFWLLDKQFMTVYVNPATEEMLGYAKEEMIGRSWYDFGDPEWIARAKELEKRRATGVREAHQFLFIHKDGRKVLTRIATTPLYDKDGSFDGALGVLSDITKQEEANDALKNKSMLNAIAGSSGIGMCVINPDHTIAWYNDLHAKWFGALEKTKGRNCFEVFEGRDTICPDCPSRVSFQTGGVAVAERTGITTSAGADRIVALTTSPLRDADGDVIQVVEIAQDITERKRAEEELRESHERLGLALDGGELGMWDWDLRTDAVTYSDRWAQMLEYRPDEVEPSVDFFRRHVHPEDLPAVLDRLAGHVEGRTRAYASEHRLRTKSGGLFWAMDRGRVVESDQDGRPVRVAGIIADITERKRAEEALRESEDRFSRAFQTSPYAITITHAEDGKFVEINDAFTSMTGFSREEALADSAIGLKLWVKEEDRRHILTGP